MGNTTSQYVRSLFSSEFFYAEKRKRDSCDEDEEYDRGRCKRRRLRNISAPKYIYKEMFEQGVYSDIRIVALNKEWNLHRVHLKQCPYFASMLSGAWKEANQDVITIDVVDPNITVEALDAMFGSLYLDEIELDRKNIIPILAAAAHFRMDKLAERCGDIMIENTNHSVVLKYYNIAEQYGLKKVREATFDYIVTNIVPNPQLWPIYPQISVELMASLVSHPNLVVQDSEQNVYMMVLKWLYRCLTQNKEKKRTHSEIASYFCNRKGPEFLLTEEGIIYQPAFKALNLQAILITHASVRMLLSNNVIPAAWINSAIMANYVDYLKANEGRDEGPTEEDILEVDKRGFRLGRYLKNFGTWHSVGTLNGLLLSWTFNNNALEVTRIRGGSSSDLISLAPKRRVICKVSFIRAGRPRLTIPAQVLNLDLGQKVEVYRLPDPIQLPIMLQMRLLITSTVKEQQEFCPELIVQ